MKCPECGCKLALVAEDEGAERDEAKKKSGPPPKKYDTTADEDND